jgi:putative colanic acid biosynthesis glycosyltransferase
VEKAAVRLSIVVVTYRDPAGVARTLDSLVPMVENRFDVECLVVDGGTDREELASATSGHAWADVVSEPDGGIYDAMNKGLRRSRGDYVWFLNGGDESLVKSPDLFLKELDPDSRKILMFGYDLHYGPGSKRKRARAASYLFHGLPTSHQAILYPGVKARLHEYNTSYRITGDYAFTSALVVDGLKLVRRRDIIARFYTGGTSQAAGRELSMEAARVQREILRCSLPARIVSRSLHAISQRRRLMLAGR